MRPRGAAMIETVSVMSLILALLFGSAQLVLIGFYQLQIDAATFMYSHAFSTIGSVPSSKLQPVIPVVPVTAITTQPSAPPQMETQDANGLAVLGEYTTGGIPTGPTNAVKNRYGGASVIVPQQIVTQSKMTIPTFNISVFSVAPTISGGNIEGRAMVLDHDDDSTGYGYNSGNAAGNLISPYTVGGDDQNVPPYYFSHAYMNYFTCSASANSGCFNSNRVALGQAEFLNDVSYSGATNGNYNIGANGAGQGQVFGAMTQHQQEFAEEAQAILPIVTLAQAQASGTSGPVYTYPNTCYAAWDLSIIGLNASGEYGTRYPTTPLARPSGC